MNQPPKPKGPWLSRFAVRFLTLTLGVLFYWLLGFLVEDIESIPGPQYEPIEARYLDPALVQKKEAQEKQLAELAREVEAQTEAQRLVGSGSQNLQQTINQLLALQKAGIEKNIALPETQQANVTESLALFLQNQKKYQDLNQTLADLLRRKRVLEGEKQAAEQQIEEQRKPAHAEFERVSERHRLRLAFYHLLVLVPLLALGAAFIWKMRASIYFPLALAFASATAIKIAVVIHEYFPSRYIKYVLIGALLIVVARLLIYFIRTIAAPKLDFLFKQYREAYERFLCPVCEYPIRLGPRKYLFWTRRTVNKLVVPSTAAPAEETYSCPACSTALFEECAACHKVRHGLLPYCEHCGAAKPLPAAA